jgi:hypothetical protein
MGTPGKLKSVQLRGLQHYISVLQYYNPKKIFYPIFVYFFIISFLPKFGIIFLDIVARVQSRGLPYG